MFSNHYYAQHPEGGFKYSFNHGVPSRENSKLAAKIFLNGLDRIEAVKVQYTDEQRALIRSIDELRSFKTTPFSREEEIIQLRRDSKELAVKIDNNISGKQPVPVQTQSIAKPAENDEDDWDEEEIEEDDNEEENIDILSDEWVDKM